MDIKRKGSKETDNVKRRKTVDISDKYTAGKRKRKNDDGSDYSTHGKRKRFADADADADADIARDSANTADHTILEKYDDIEKSTNDVITNDVMTVASSSPKTNIDLTESDRFVVIITLIILIGPNTNHF